MLGTRLKVELTKKLVIFDLDGVIVDTRRNMEQAWRDVCAQFDLSVPFTHYYRNIGRPFHDILSILGLEKWGEEIALAYGLSSREHPELILEYPGVMDALEILSDAGVKLGIVTSKDAARTEILLDSMSVAFDVVQTPNEIYRGKPAPDHLLFVLAAANVDPTLSCYIGDMVTDWECAQRAGISYAHANWGYGCLSGEDCVKLDDSEDLLNFAGIGEGR